MRMLVYLRAVCITAWMSLSRYFTLSHGKFLHTLESPLSAILNRRSSKESHHHRSSKLYYICCTVYALWFRTQRTRQDESGNIPKIDWFLCVIVFSSHGSEQTTHCMHCSPDVSTGNFFVSRRHFVYFIHWNLDGEIFIYVSLHSFPSPPKCTTLRSQQQQQLYKHRRIHWEGWRLFQLELFMLGNSSETRERLTETFRCVKTFGWANDSCEPCTELVYEPDAEVTSVFLALAQPLVRSDQCAMTCPVPARNTYIPNEDAKNNANLQAIDSTKSFQLRSLCVCFSLQCF